MPLPRSLLRGTAILPAEPRSACAVHHKYGVQGPRIRAGRSLGTYCQQLAEHPRIWCVCRRFSSPPRLTITCPPRTGAGLYSFFQVRTGLAVRLARAGQRADDNVPPAELRPRLPEHVQLPAAERGHRLELVDRDLHALHCRLAVHAQRERPGHRPELGEQERLRANTHLVDSLMTGVGLLSWTRVGSRGEGLRIHKASERWNRGRAGGCSLVCITMHIVDGRQRNLKSWNGSGGGGIVRLMLTYEYSRVSLGFSWVCNLLINGVTKCARMLGEQFILCHRCNCSNR